MKLAIRIIFQKIFRASQNLQGFPKEKRPPQFGWPLCFKVGRESGRYPLRVLYLSICGQDGPGIAAYCEAKVGAVRSGGGATSVVGSIVGSAVCVMVSGICGSAISGLTGAGTFDPKAVESADAVAGSGSASAIASASASTETSS